MITIPITLQNKYQVRFIQLMVERLKQNDVEGMISEANIRTAIGEIESFSAALEDSEADVMALAVSSATFMANLFCFLDNEIERAQIRQDIMKIE